MICSRIRALRPHSIQHCREGSIPGFRWSPTRFQRRLPGYSLDDLFDEYAKREGLERHNKRTENDPTKSQYDFAKLQQFYPSGDDGSGWMDLPIYNEGPEPGEGPLEKQVGMSLKEAMESDKVNPKDAKYWFTEPPGGWNNKSKRVQVHEEDPGFFANAKSPEHGRASISDLKEGDVFYGIVTEVWYHHGIKVDIGFDYDGLLPMLKESWEEFGNTLEIGKAVKVQVVKIWKQDLYRWPVQLTALDPRIRRFEILADEWDPPIDFRGKSLAEIERYTNRTLPTLKCFLPDEDFGEEFLFDSEDEEDKVEDKREMKKQEAMTEQEILDVLQEEFFLEMEDVLRTVNSDLF